MPLASTALLCLVIAVGDGDSLRARCGKPGAYRQVSVRLSAVDAPEMGQAFGRQAKRALSELTYRKPVQLNCVQTDRYRRRVCQVMVAPPSCTQTSCAKTLDAGLTMVTLGLAWWSRAHAGQQTPTARGQHAFAEFEAKAKRAGLWADPKPMAPWAWRAQHPSPSHRK